LTVSNDILTVSSDTTIQIAMKTIIYSLGLLYRPRTRRIRSRMSHSKGPEDHVV